MKIVDGSLVLYFCYDVAFEIRLDRIETALGQKPLPGKLKVIRIAPDYVQYRTPPVWVPLGNRSLRLMDSDLKFTVDAKLYDFGVITLRYTLPISCELSGLKRYGYELTENDELEADAAAVLEALRKDLLDCLVSPKAVTFESYAVYSVSKFEQPILAKELLERHWEDLATALCCEERRLSESELHDSIKGAMSYYPEDLVVVDWNAAFVWEPEPSYEIFDVIEYAVIELLELRTYDELLDRTLDQAFDDITVRRGRLFDRSMHRVMQRLGSTRLEVLDVIDKVENALKLFADLYLAKVYQSASERFGLQSWKKSLQKKLDTLMSTYEMLNHEVENHRLLVLEVWIVALFVVDIALVLLLPHA